ncbi:DUF4232 domain-containing protein [Cryptosporangium phraense]|nr:DUF4232 domain-containing protein [Cryptosporangium phraense]
MLAAGCSSDRDGTPAGGALRPEPATAQGGSHDVQATNGPGGTCSAGQLRIRVIRQPPDAVGGPVYALVTLTNDSSTACVLSGWPNTSVAGDGKVIPREVPQPAPPVRVSLADGESAYAALRWSACTKSGDACVTRARLHLGPPGDHISETTLIGVPSGESPELAISALQVGTIQSGTSNILNWS